MCRTTVWVAIGVALFIGSCTNSEPDRRVSSAKSDNRVLASQNQLFTPEVVDRFRATDFTSFLGRGPATFRPDNLGGVLFKMQPGYLGGGTLRSSVRGVGIAVFESKQAALAAVKARRHNVAAVIHQGQQERNLIKHWWFSESQALLSIVHHNVVVEVSDLRRRYSETEKELWATATGFIRTAEPTTPAVPIHQAPVVDRSPEAAAVLIHRLEKVCQALKAQAGGEWEPGLHNGFRYGVLVVRGRLRDASRKTVANYHVLPIGAGVDRYGRRALGMCGKAHTKVSILGLGPRFIVVEFLRVREDEAVKKARVALVKTLELSPPRITVDMYRRVLVAAERALERAQGKSLPDVAPARRNSIAVGQTPSIEERDGAFRFVWEMITSNKTGFRVTAQREKEGKVSILEVTLGL